MLHYVGKLEERKQKASNKKLKGPKNLHTNMNLSNVDVAQFFFQGSM